MAGLALQAKRGKRNPALSLCKKSSFCMFLAGIYG